MRLIDADALDKKLFADGFISGLSGALNCHKTRTKYTIGEFRTLLNQAPTIEPENELQEAQYKLDCLTHGTQDFPRAYREAVEECEHFKAQAQALERALKQQVFACKACVTFPNRVKVCCDGCSFDRLEKWQFDYERFAKEQEVQR